MCEHLSYEHCVSISDATCHSIIQCLQSLATYCSHVFFYIRVYLVLLVQLLFLFPSMSIKLRVCVCNINRFWYNIVNDFVKTDWSFSHTITTPFMVR